MGSKVLSLSKDEYSSLGGLLSGQEVVLKISGSVLDATDRMVTLGVKSIAIASKSKLSTNEIVQQLAASREKMAGAEARA